jgi:hypothetical protein
MDIENNQVDSKEIVNEADASGNMASVASKPTDVSRSDLIAKMVDYAMKCDKGELADFIARVGTAGPNSEVPNIDALYATSKAAGNGAGDKSAQNMASIKSSGKNGDPMPSVKEDLALLFGDSDDLSEDFRIKTETLFEAAVSTRVNMEVAKIQEDYEARTTELEETFNTSLEEAVTEIKNEMVENVDNYLNYAVAEWISENKLAVENNIRTQMAESFMASLKDVFTEHYVNIPDDQVDVVEAMAAELEEVKARLNETTEKNIELAKTVNEKAIEEIKSTMSEGMTDTQKDKFVKLSEAVNYSDVEEFRKKVSIIKETYLIWRKNQLMQ